MVVKRVVRFGEVCICDFHLQETGLDFDDELRHLERESRNVS